MNFKLIYPKWAKLEKQTEFHLPPHGPVVFAAALPDHVAVEFIDENLEEIPFDEIGLRKDEFRRRIPRT